MKSGPTFAAATRWPAAARAASRPVATVVLPTPECVPATTRRGPSCTGSERSSAGRGVCDRGLRAGRRRRCELLGVDPLHEPGEVGFPREVDGVQLLRPALDVDHELA